MDNFSPVLYEVTALLDSAQIAAASSDANWTGQPGAVHVAPDEQFAALVAPERESLVLVSFQSQKAAAAGEYRPRSAGAKILRCSWTADSDRIVVAVSTGALVVLDRSLQVQRELSSGLFGNHKPVDIVCCGGDDLLLLTADGSLRGLDISAGTQLFVENIQKLHSDPRALAFCLKTETALIASHKSSSPHVVVSAWKCQDRRPSKLFQLSADYGLRSVLDLPSIPPPAWSIQFSPLAEYAAVAVAGHKVVVIDLQKKKEIEPFQKFGGKEVKTTPGLTYFARESVSNIASFCWWSDSCFGLSDIYGSVALATLPGYVNVLGTKPPQCTPGTAVAAVERLQRRALLVLEPIVLTSPSTASSPRSGRSKSRKKDKGAAAAAEGAARLQGWRLKQYEERTPEEMVAVHLRSQDWDAAAEVARTHELDGDMIYQARWSAGLINQSNIQDNLALIGDKRWVVEECLRRIAVTAEAQRLLLQTGLKYTEDMAKEAYGHADKADDYYWTIVKRVQLLHYLERLDTLLTTLQSDYEGSGYEAFRDLDLLEAGAAYAETGNLFALQQLLQRHPSLHVNAFKLLSALPETLEPHFFSTLLPKADGSLSLGGDPVAPTDWVESLDTVQTLRFMGYENLVHATEALCALQGVEPPTAQQVEEWYCQRALEIDERSGQLQLAVSLLELGQQKGVKGRVPLLQHLATSLLRAITTVGNAGAGNAGEGSSWLVGLKAFISMSEAEQLALLLRNSSEATVADDITGCVMPYMQGLPAESQTQMLEVLIEGNINQRLGWCVRLVDLECAQPVLYRSPVLLAKATTRGLLGCKSSSQWSQLTAMVDAVIHHLNSALYQENAEEIQTVLDTCNGLMGCIKAAQLLTKQGLVMTISEVHTADQSATVKAIQQLLARAVRSGRQKSDKDWQALWRDLHAAQTAGLHTVSSTETLELYVRSLLSAGRFHLASGYLHGVDGVHLPRETAEQLVVNEALNFLYSASSLEDDNITISRRCLDLVPDAEAGKRLANTIQGLLELPHWGVNILPLQFKQLTDRLQVVDMILAARPTAYNQLPALVKVAGMLGVEEGDQMYQVKLKAATSAMRTGAVDAAAGIAQQLSDAGFTPAWELCAALGRDTRVSDRDQRRELLSFALGVCPDKELGQLVDDLKALNSEPGLRPTIASYTPAQIIFHPGSHSPEAADLSLAVHNLLFLPGEDEAADILCALEAECNGDFFPLQRVLMMGVYVHALKCLDVVNGGMVTQETLAKAQKLLKLPLAELVREAQHRPATRSTHHMQQFQSRLDAVRNKRKLQQLLPHMDTSKNDVASQRESTLQLASLAGQVALQPDTDGDARDAAANGALHKSLEAQKLLQQAHALGTQCGVKAWEVKMTYVQSLVVASPDPASQQVVAVVDLHKAELLEQPADMLGSLYAQLYPLLPTTSSPHLAFTIGLMIDAAKALPQSANTPVATSILPCLEKLRSRLKNNPPALSSLSFRLVASGLVNGLLQMVLGPEVVRPLDEVYSLEAFAAIYAFTEQSNVEALGAVLKDLRNIAAVAMKSAEAHQLSHCLPLTVTRHLTPSLPFLCLACKHLCSLTPPDPTLSSPTSRSPAAGPAAATAVEATGGLWSHIGPKQLALAISFFLGVTSRQPLREEAVGRLYPRPLSAGHKLQILQAALPAMQGTGAVAPDLAKMMAPLQRLQRQLLGVQAVADVDSLTQEQVDEAESSLLAKSMSASLPSYLQHLVLQACPAHAVHDVAAALWALWQEDVAHKSADSAGTTAYQSPVEMVTGVVERAVIAQLEAVRQQLRGDNSVDGNPIASIAAIITSLEGHPGGTSHSTDSFTVPRNLVWEHMQQLCTSLTAAELQQEAGQQLLALQSDLASGQRWPGWQLPEGQHYRLLHARTKALLADQWPDVQVREQDVSSCEAAESFFTLMVAASTKPKQLQLLSQLLQDVWMSGRIWQQPETISTVHLPDEPSLSSLPLGAASTAGQGEGGVGESKKEWVVTVEPLHGCWRELMVSMLQDQVKGDVLRVLDRRAVHLHGGQGSGATSLSRVQGVDSSTGVAGEGGSGQGNRIEWPMDEEEYSSVIAEGDLSVSRVLGVSLGLLSPFPAQVQQALQDLEQISSEELEVDGEFIALILKHRALGGLLANSAHYERLSQFLVGSVRGIFPTAGSKRASLTGAQSAERATSESERAGQMSVTGRAAGYDPVGFHSILVLTVVCVLCVDDRVSESLSLLVQLTGLHGALTTFDGCRAVLHRYLDAYRQRGLNSGVLRGKTSCDVAGVWAGLMESLPDLLDKASRLQSA